MLCAARLSAGANDVAMIQEAHCGVGIAGLEGAQASMSADYAIGQFRFLTKLLLVHGHWSYVRIADMHKVFFYKNIIWTFTMFWFQIFSGFDATYLYDYSYVLLFNLVFTSLPVIILGALDQDVHPKAIFAYPGTYKRGIAGLEYTRGLFWSAVIDAVYQSAICFFIPYCIWALFPVSSADGLDLGSLWFFGTTIGAGAVISANLYAGLTMRFWTWIFWAIEAISILSYFVWALIYSAFPTWLYDDVAYWLYATVIFWTTVLLVVVLCLLPRFFFKAWRIAFNPTEVDIVRESWVKGDLKEQLGLREKKSYNMTDVETGNDLFVAAKNSTERSRSHLAADDNISETSADPFPTDYEQHYVRYDGNPNPTNPNSRVVRSPDDELEELNDPYQDQAQSSRSPPHDSSPGERTGTAFSFYDPERLPSASPQMMTSPHAHSHSAHKQQQQGQQQQQDAHNRGFEVPSINVQRASVQSYEVGQAISPDGEASYGYPAYSGAATSTTHLAEKSTDSFNAQFEEAFGPHSPGAGQEAMAHLDEFASADPYVTGNGAPTPTQRAYHDRFREQSPPAATPTQAHHHYPQPQLNAHQQEDSGASWHTAGDHDPTQHDGWRDR